MKIFRLISITIFISVFTSLTLPHAFAEDADKVLAARKKAAPKMVHAKTLPGELCVTCHMESEAQDPESITPKINNKHDVCNKCHLPDGKTVTGHCGCEDASDPMDCESCHTSPAMGDNPSAEEMNDLCLDCHG